MPSDPVRCNACGREGTDLLACGNCLEVYFCDTACLKEAWPSHRSECCPCWICKKKKVPGKPVHRGCSCRGTEGFAHLDCLVQHAVGSNHAGAWQRCSVCHKPFTEKLLQYMAEEQLRRASSGNLRHKLTCLVEVGHAHLNNFEPREALAILQECVDICKQLYGDNVWNGDDFYTHTNLASALSNCGRTEEALKTFELVQSKLKEQGITSWINHDVVAVNQNLAIAYMNLNNHKALPILKEWVKNERYLDDSGKIRGKMMLATAYLRTGDRTLARKMAEQAFKDSKTANGRTHPLTVECKSTYEQAVMCSYIFGRSVGIDDIPDGEIMEIRGYLAEDGMFDIVVRSDISSTACSTIAPPLHIRGSTSVRDCMLLSEEAGHRDPFIKIAAKVAKDYGVSEKSLLEGMGGIPMMTLVDDDHNQYMRAGVKVAVDNVIMDNRSDVVLHSLKGDTCLNGKTGVISGFNSETGRYVVKVKGRTGDVAVKPQKLLPAYMGCHKKDIVAIAKKISEGRALSTDDKDKLAGNGV